MAIFPFSPSFEITTTFPNRAQTQTLATEPSGFAPTRSLAHSVIPGASSYLAVFRVLTRRHEVRASLYVSSGRSADR